MFPGLRSSDSLQPGLSLDGLSALRAGNCCERVGSNCDSEATSDFLIVEFEYLLSGEETSVEKLSDTIELEVGKNSRRIYKIRINVVQLKCDSVRLEIEPITKNVIGAIKQFSSRFPEKVRDRYKLTERLMFNNRDHLLSTLASS